jgi:hypothetical protein
VPKGAHVLRAVATDNRGATNTSALVNFVVSNTPPTVALTLPTNSAVFIVGDIIPLAATAGDVDGTIASVQFFAGTNIVASVTNAPYQFAWSNLVAGSYALTALATDDNGATTTSAVVNVTVNTNQFPQATITTPTNNSSYLRPVDISVSATASDADGSVVLLELYAGAVKLGQSTSNTLNLVWTNAPKGTNILMAVATDDRGATNTSLLVNVVVTNTPIPLILAVAPDVQNGQLILRYDRPVGSLNSEYELQASGDLVNWTSASGLVISETTLAIDAVTERVTLRVNLLPSTAQFFRIEATNN